ncbi:hypothetical protein ACLMJK_002599 [Lecanora helva]
MIGGLSRFNWDCNALCNSGTEEEAILKIEEEEEAEAEAQPHLRRRAESNIHDPSHDGAYSIPRIGSRIRQREDHTGARSSNRASEHSLTSDYTRNIDWSKETLK